MKQASSVPREVKSFPRVFLAKSLRLILVLMVLLATGCASYRRFYDGEARPLNEVAVLARYGDVSAADSKAVPLSAAEVAEVTRPPWITTVDGRKVVGPPATYPLRQFFEVVGGKHEIVLDWAESIGGAHWENNTFGGTMMRLREPAQMEFTAEPGKVYEVAAEHGGAGVRLFIREASGEGRSRILERVDAVRGKSPARRSPL